MPCSDRYKKNVKDAKIDRLPVHHRALPDDGFWLTSWSIPFNKPVAAPGFNV
jgi:hypothetical protein